MSAWVYGAKMECIEGILKGQFGTLESIIFQGRSGAMDLAEIKLTGGTIIYNHPSKWQVVSHVKIEPATSLNFMR